MIVGPRNSCFLLVPEPHNVALVSSVSSWSHLGYFNFSPSHSRHSYQPCEGGQNVVGRVWNQYWERKTFLESIQLICLSSGVCQGPPLPARMSGEVRDFWTSAFLPWTKWGFCYLGKGGWVVSNLSCLWKPFTVPGTQWVFHVCSLILLLLSSLVYWIWVLLDR